MVPGATETANAAADTAIRTTSVRRRPVFRQGVTAAWLTIVVHLRFVAITFAVVQATAATAFAVIPVKLVKTIPPVAQMRSRYLRPAQAVRSVVVGTDTPQTSAVPFAAASNSVILFVCVMEARILRVVIWPIPRVNGAAHRLDATRRLQL